MDKVQQFLDISQAYVKEKPTKPYYTPSPLKIKSNELEIWQFGNYLDQEKNKSKIIGSSEHNYVYLLEINNWE